MPVKFLWLVSTVLWSNTAHVGFKPHVYILCAGQAAIRSFHMESLEIGLRTLHSALRLVTGGKDGWVLFYSDTFNFHWELRYSCSMSSKAVIWQVFNGRISESPPSGRGTWQLPGLGMTVVIMSHNGLWGAQRQLNDPAYRSEKNQQASGASKL